MRYQGIATPLICQTLSKPVAAVTTYINNWNKYGLDTAIDFRGGSKPTFTEAMKEDVKRV